MPDALNFTDCFTKWTKLDKFEASLAFITGATMRAAYADVDATAEKVRGAGGYVLLAALADAIDCALSVVGE